MIYDSLEAYLLTDVVREDHVRHLTYAADVFLLDRHTPCMYASDVCARRSQ